MHTIIDTIFIHFVGAVLGIPDANNNQASL